MNDDTSQPAGKLSAFRPVPRTGVIYVTTEAAKRGFSHHRSGLVQPRARAARDRPAARRAAARAARVTIDVDDQEYAPVAGIWELREAIAGALQPALPARDAVAVPRRERRASRAAGARRSRARRPASGTSTSATSCPTTPPTRSCSTSSRPSRAIPILLEGERGYAFSADDLRREMHGPRPLGAAAVEPVQPDRQAGAGRRARALGGARARARLRAPPRRVLLALRLDRAPPGRLPVESAARYVEDVDRDPVVLFDGLTKNWRYPGWRVTWTVGPRAGDRGGRQRRLVPRRRRLASRCSAPPSRCSPTTHVVAETEAIHARLPREARPPAAGARAPRRRDRPRARRHVLRAGAASTSCRRRSTTAWASSAPRSSSKVIIVPGEFFDVNPGKRRHRPRLALPPPRPLLVRPLAWSSSRRRSGGSRRS